MPPTKQSVDDLVARSKAMVAQTQAQGATPFAGSVYEQKPIAVDALGTSATPLNIPTYNPNVDYYGTASGVTASALQPMPTPPTQPPSTEVTSLGDRLRALLPNFNQQAPASRTSAEEIAAAKQAETQALAKFDEYSAQLKALEAERTAIPEQIQAEFEGRGVTAAGVAPIETARLRDNYLRTVPIAVQADIAANRLTNAQNKINTLLDIQEKDQTAQSNYYNTLFSRALTIASADQQDEIRLKQQELANWQAQQEDFNATRRSFVTAAINNGNYELAARLGAAQDMNSLNSMAGQLTSISTTGFEVPTVKTINGVDMQWNPQTGKWEPIAGGQVPGGQSPYQTERQTRTLQSVLELGQLARANPSIFGRSAAVPIPTFLRSDAFRNFSSELDTLKSNIITSELTAMREASKTGGALGNVSDRESAFLQNALGALNMSQSPENFQRQLTKIYDSIRRWQAAVQQSSSQTGIPITAPNGEQVIITD